MKPGMKIAMVDPSLFTGRYDDSLCTALAGQGHEVTLHARPQRSTDALEPQGYVYDERFFCVSERLRGLLGDGSAFRTVKAAEYLLGSALGSLAALRSADVVHVQWSPFVPADRLWLGRLAAGKGRPALVHTVHNAQANHGEAPGRMGGYRALLDLYDRLIVHGDETQRALLSQGIAPERIAIVPHPPMALASAGAEDLAAVPDARRPRLLFFGTIRPYKGFDLLIDACLQLWREGADFELAVAGKPFMNIAPLLDKVRDAGMTDRLILDLDFLKEERLDAHLQKADMLLFPYRHIDSSGAFLSALRYGKPMICSRVGMFASLPPVAGEQAVALCELEDAESLAGTVRPLLASEAMRRGMGEKSLALLEQMGDWNDAAAATAQVYQQAINQMKAGRSQ